MPFSLLRAPRSRGHGQQRPRIVHLASIGSTPTGRPPLGGFFVCVCVRLTRERASERHQYQPRSPNNPCPLLPSRSSSSSSSTQAEKPSIPSPARGQMAPLLRALAHAGHLANRGSILVAPLPPSALRRLASIDKHER